MGNFLTDATSNTTVATTVNVSNKVAVDYDGSKLFYPTYCCAKTAPLDCLPQDNKNNNNSNVTQNPFDYYMTVGLNSNIKKDAFQRKCLNLIILLDVSGSMGSSFYDDNNNNTKMTVANKAVVRLLDHLNDNDRFGLTTFDSCAEIVQPLTFVKNIKMKLLKDKILNIKENGGTDFSKGYESATSQLREYSLGNKQNISKYDNRIIMLTDAQPNIGVTNPNSLLYVVAKNADDKRKMAEMDKIIEEQGYPDDMLYPGDDSDDGFDDYEQECCIVDDNGNVSQSDNDDNTIGLAVGGANDVNQYRQCIDNNIMPTVTSITYNGLLNEYYFDTKKRNQNKMVPNTTAAADDDNKSGSVPNSKNDNNSNIAPIYTTFIGVGLDFNTKLIDEISNTTGCNYFVVNSSKEFMEQMDDQQFEYMVTPLVFNVCLTLKCNANEYKIDKVYGSNDKQQKNILENGEIKRIHTLFPSKKSSKKGGTKGGIQLIKLKKINNNINDNNGDDVNVLLQVTYQDRYGQSYSNAQVVRFQSPNLKIKKQNKDMIDDDNYDNFDALIHTSDDYNFYDNIGIRKGILLCNYVELIHSWIESTGSGPLTINDQYKKLFQKFLTLFTVEMGACKDNTLEKEKKIIQKLITL